ncbi:hypothetical protein KBB12_02580, partial [Candidatus Woesebacteria bacterium]|nr:hypothetical protein [Candidatus Woesebacteria bacterium]
FTQTLPRACSLRSSAYSLSDMFAKLHQKPLLVVMVIGGISILAQTLPFLETPPCCVCRLPHMFARKV